MIVRELTQIIDNALAMAINLHQQRGITPEVDELRSSIRQYVVESYMEALERRFHEIELVFEEE